MQQVLGSLVATMIFFNHALAFEHWFLWIDGCVNLWIGE